MDVKLPPNRIDKRAERISQWQMSETSPVLEMPPSRRLWQKVKWPLVALILLSVLITVGVMTYGALLDRMILQRIEEAARFSAQDTVDSHETSLFLLDELHQDYPRDARISVAWAWERILVEARLGGLPRWTKGVAPVSKEELSKVLDQASGKADPIQEKTARAGLLLLRNRPDEALTLVEGAIQEAASPGSLLLFVKGLAERDLGRIPEATKTLKAISEQDPRYLPALSSLLRLHLEQGENAEAAAVTREILKVSPAHHEALLASITEDLERQSRSVPEPAKVDAIFGRSDQILKTSPPFLLAFARYVQGRLFLARGETGQAVASFKAAWEAAPGRLLESYWYARGLSLLGRFQESLKVLDAFSDGRAPGRTLVLRLSCELALHRIDAATATLDRLARAGTTRVPENLSGLYDLRSGRIEEAAGRVERMGGEAPDADLLAEIALGLSRIGEARRARSLLKKSLSNESIKKVRCIRGLSAWFENDVAKAFNLFEEGASDEVCSARALIRLGIGIIPISRLEKLAAVWDDRAVDLSFRLIRAQVLLRTHGLKRAMESLNAIKETRPDAPPLLVDLAAAFLDMNDAETAARIAATVKSTDDWGARARAVQIGYFLDRNQTEEASRYFDDARKNHPVSSALLAMEAKVKLAQNDFTAAAAAAGEALKHPSDLLAETLAAGSIALNNQSRRAEADTLLREGVQVALEAVGPEEKLDVGIAVVRLNLRRGGKFISRCAEAVVKMEGEVPASAVLFYYHGITLERQNADGTRWFQKALEVDPGYAEPYSRLFYLGRLGADQKEDFERIFPYLELK